MIKPVAKVNAMKFFATCALVLSVISSGAFATVESPGNIRATVNGTTSFDSNTGLYTYSYSITNYGDSPKSVHEFHIPLRDATILNIVSPAGWEAAVNRAQTMVGWCACREDGFVPPAGYVNDGRGIPSKYVVKPGATLSGFSFQSPYPPSPGIFFAGGWVPIPVEGIDFPEGQEPALPEFPMNMLKGEVTGPLKSDVVYRGGRRPAVDGFLVFMNMRDGEAYSTPVIVDILFSQNGENVLLSSFKASLNGQDVTASFKVIDVNRRRAVFDAGGGSALKIGKNTLNTAVDGTVPGSQRKATDTDRVIFIAR